MEISQEQDALVLERMDAFLTEMLRQLPACADPQGSEEATKRLYPKPSTSTELNQEWIEYVQPELRQLFQTANATVSADLKTLSEEADQGFKLRIPLAHADQWLSTLNQARLVLAERNGFGEADISANTRPVLRSVRDVQLFQIHFYGVLQELLLSAL